MKMCLSDPGEFPHMTAIGYSAELDETKYSFDCGGSLISLVSSRGPQWFISLNLFYRTSSWRLVTVSTAEFASLKLFDLEGCRYKSTRKMRRIPMKHNSFWLRCANLTKNSQKKSCDASLHFRKLPCIRNILRERSIMTSHFWKWRQMFSTKKSSNQLACTPKANQSQRRMTWSSRNWIFYFGDTFLIQRSSFIVAGVWSIPIHEKGHRGYKKRTSKSCLWTNVAISTKISALEVHLTKVLCRAKFAQQANQRMEKSSTPVKVITKKNWSGSKTYVF